MGMDFTKFIILCILVTNLLILFPAVSAATLECEQITDSSISVPQFTTKNIQIMCTASDGTVSNIELTKNTNPGTGLSFSTVQTIGSTLNSGSSGIQKWTVTGDLPNSYEVSYTINSDSTNTWTGSSKTEVDVTTPAKLNIQYYDPPESYSSGDTLSFEIDNIGGSTANNVIMKLYRDGNLVDSENFPKPIDGGSSTSYAWGSSNGFDRAGTYLTKIFIETSEHNSDTVTVSEQGTTPVCGNGILESGEECDDGNTADNDGCSSTCQNEDQGDDDDDDDGGSSSSSTSSSTAPTYIPPVKETIQENEQGKDKKSWENVVSGDDIEMQINKTNLSLNSISFIINKNESLMTLVVTNVGEIPKPIKSIDETYEMIELNTINFDSDDIKDLKIGFQVAKEWLEEEVLAIGDIIVMSLDGEDWSETVATKTGEDDSFYYFMSEPNSLDFIAVGARRPILLTSLKPTEEELRKISLDGLEDPLIKRKLQEYYEFAVDFEASKEATSGLADKLTLSKELKILDDGKTRIDIVVKSLGSSVNDIVLVEPIPKIILENVAEIAEPNPPYDVIIKEDPIIQWRFKEVDTAIVAWHIKRIEGNGDYLISYKVDGEFGSEDHVSSMLVKIIQKTQSPTGRVVQEKADIDEIESENNWKLYGLFFFTLIVFVGVIVYIFRTQKKEPSEKTEEKAEKETSFPDQKQPNVNTVAAAVRIKKIKKHEDSPDDTKKATSKTEKEEVSSQQRQPENEKPPEKQQMASQAKEAKSTDNEQPEIYSNESKKQDTVSEEPSEQIKRIREKLKTNEEVPEKENAQVNEIEHDQDNVIHQNNHQNEPKVVVLPPKDEQEKKIAKTSNENTGKEKIEKPKEHEIVPSDTKNPTIKQRSNEPLVQEQTEALEKYYKMVFEDYTPVDQVLEFKKKHNLTDKMIKQFLKSKK